MVKDKAWGKKLKIFRGHVAYFREGFGTGVVCTRRLGGRILTNTSHGCRQGAVSEVHTCKQKLFTSSHLAKEERHEERTNTTASGSVNKPVAIATADFHLSVSCVPVTNTDVESGALTLMMSSPDRWWC